MVELFFPFSEHTIFFILIGFGLFLLFSRDGRIPTWYHLDLLMILAWVPLPDYEVGDLEVTMVLGWLPLFYWIPRLLYLFVRTPEPEAEARLGKRHLQWLVGLAAVYVVFLAFVSPYPFGEVGDSYYHLSDSAMIGYRGANRMLEGMLPYSAGAAAWGRVYPYGPAYYLPYIPIAHFFPESDPTHSYCLGARLYGILLAAGGAAGLFWLGRRMGGSRFGWAWALFWLASPYVHNSVYWAQSSHLLPGALTTLGLAALVSSPVISGAILGFAAASAYYPLVFLPLWARASKRLYLFVIGFFAVLGATFLPVFLARDGLTRFLNHMVWQEGSMLGRPVSDRWSPWAQHPPLLPLRFVLMVVFAGIVLFLMLRAWRGSMSIRKAAIGSAVIMAGMQVWREHAPGRYHLWLFPLLVIACLWPARHEAEDGEPALEPAEDASP